MHYFKKILSLHFQLWWLLLPKKMLICFMVRKLVADRLSNFMVGCLWRGTSLLFDANSISIITKEGVHSSKRMHGRSALYNYTATSSSRSSNTSTQQIRQGMHCRLIGLSRIPQPVSPCHCWWQWHRPKSGSSRCKTMPARTKDPGKWCLGEHNRQSVRNQKVVFVLVKLSNKLWTSTRTAAVCTLPTSPEIHNILWLDLIMDLQNIIPQPILHSCTRIRPQWCRTTQ